MSDVGPFWAGERADEAHEVARALAEATAPVDDLGAAADRLNDALDQAEALFEKRFRVPGSVDVVTYGKVGSEWGIFVFLAGSQVPLTKTSLLVRVETAHLLDELWAKCEIAEAAASKNVVEARQAVLAFLERRGSKEA